MPIEFWEELFPYWFEFWALYEEVLLCFHSSSSTLLAYSLLFWQPCFLMSPSLLLVICHPLFPFSSVLQTPLTCLSSTSLPPSFPPLFLHSLALFDWSLSLDSPGCIQVKLLIAWAVGGVRRWLTAAQPVPLQGARGYWAGPVVLCWTEAGACW